MIIYVPATKLVARVISTVADVPVGIPVVIDVSVVVGWGMSAHSVVGVADVYEDIFKYCELLVGAIEGRLKIPKNCPIDEHTIPVAVNVPIVAFVHLRAF